MLTTKRTELMEFSHTVSGHTGGSGDPVQDHEEDLVFQINVSYTVSALQSGDASNIELEGFRQRSDCREEYWEPYDHARFDDDEALWDRLREEAFEILVTRWREKCAEIEEGRGDYERDMRKDGER